MKSRLFLIPLAFVSLILISITALAGQETRLGAGHEPDIYGDRVVWSSNGSIHLFDINSRTDTELNSSSASHPAVHGDKVVWLDNSTENPNLCIYNISTGEKFLITENVTGDSNYRTGSKPAIYGNIIVWQNFVDNENQDQRAYNVYMYNLSSLIQTKISNYGCLYGRPDIYEDRIVWVNDSGVSGDGGPIWMYNISTGNKTEIEADYSYDCAIYGDRLVSNKYTFGYFVSVYNLSTNEVSGAKFPSEEFDPDIYMDRVVWRGESNCTSNIYMYDMSTANATRISANGSAYDPSIYGDRIVWEDMRTNQSDIYMYDLSAKPIKPKASFTANVTSGKSPLTVLFTDTSTGGTPTYWHWDFGDGIHSKHAQTATHTFRKTGEYTVSLTVTNAAESDTLTVKGCIGVSE
ncbi:PKD domain-containing protein [Methanosarcina sp. T3]|uniref:PKD domain-containing protein n=1 Tax=Methanosarcina sp. T3 TaxID=3439062 RepID=UPI003F83A650